MFFPAGVLALLAGCEPATRTPAPQAVLPVDSQAVLRVTSQPLRFPRQLDENSGLVASARYPGVLYGANDSRGGNIVYALDTLGRLVNHLQMPPGVGNTDWEALALDSHRGWVYVGDVGDNLARRPFVVVYRFREPLPLPGNGLALGLATGAVDSLRLVYPRGQRLDVEAMWVDERDGSLYLLSKRERNGSVFQVPPDAVWNAAPPVELRLRGRLPLYRTTDASWNAQTRQLLVTTYEDVLVWTAPEDTTQPWSTGHQHWRRLPWRRERQTEAITWSRTATGTFHTLSERGRDTIPHVRTVRLRSTF